MNFKRLTKYWAVLNVNRRSESLYLVNLLAANSSILLRIWIFVSLYRLTYYSMGVSQIEGVSMAETIWILALTQSLSCVASPDFSLRIEEEVRYGNVAYLLNRPYSFVFYQFACYWGRALAILPLNLGFSLGTAYFFVGPVNTSLQAILATVYLVIVGISINFLITCSIGLLAFWLEEISAFRWIYQKAYIIFGGMILPISMFPEKFRRIGEVLPFSQLFHTPALMLVKFNFNELCFFGMVQLFWLTLTALSIGLIFSRVVRNLSVNGG